MGGSIQNIVTDNEDTAKKMISFLKTNKFGRATFLPLTSMRGGGGIRNEEALKEPGVIGTADKLVYVEARFTGLAEQLLGRTLSLERSMTEFSLQENISSRLDLLLWKEN